MMVNRPIRSLMAAMLAIVAGVVAMPANADDPAGAAQAGVLSRIELGRWELHATDSKAARSLCVSDARSLLQLGHPNQRQCARFVVSETPSEITVHYTCPGAGHGRTTIGIVTPRSINIDTQGLAGGLPFQDSYTARRTGACR